MMINESHIPLGNLDKNSGVDLRKAEGKLTAEVREVRKTETKIKILKAGSVYKKMANIWQI